MKGQQRIDEFALVLLAAVIFIVILMVVWTTPTESPPVVKPTSILLTMENGTSTSFQLTISGPITNVSLSTVGVIASWITFDQNNFDVLNSTVITATVAVPNYTFPGLYQGSIIVTSTGGQANISVGITITNTPVFSTRSIPLGSFTISYTNGTQVISSASDVVVAQGYFYSKPLTLTGSVDPNQLQSAKSVDLQFNVLSTNNYGNLVIILNGVTIYDKNTGTGFVDVPVPVADLQQYNTLQIRAGDPGFYFWANTVYELQDVKLSYSFRGQFSQQFQVSLNPNEVSNFDHFQLTWIVQSYSVPLQPLSISINNQLVYDDRPPLAAINQNFNQDIFGLPLSVGQTNTVEFSFNNPASLSVSNAMLTVYYRSTQQ